MRKKITAIVVTYNRRKLLIECLDAILRQTITVDNIIVINNASTDGTELLFKNGERYDKDGILCINMETNTGGAGGFYEGIKRSVETDIEWLWIMDDDTIPTETCLEQLLAADSIIGDGKASFFASTVYGINGEYMNVPNVDLRPSENGYPYFYKHLDAGIINIVDATFVSLLIRKSAVMKCGLPCKDYFIWGDDGEYTLRLTRYFGPAYMVGKSVVIHKRIDATKLEISRFQDENRIKLYHYYVRNNIVNQLYYKKDNNQAITIAKKLIQAVISIRYLGQKKGASKLKAIWKGTIEGFLQYRGFKSYIDNQISK